jgi:hypothetical protein
MLPCTCILCNTYYRTDNKTHSLNVLNREKLAFGAIEAKAKRGKGVKKLLVIFSM